MPHKVFPDILAGLGAALAVLWTNDVSPILQAAVLVLTVLFLALGVALRWRAWRDGQPADTGSRQP
ncbi:MAG: hypothetical protein M0006_02235 [Magnetospirillum sp.]|nr:hypothetical protein [Magnetospirillum sp.]